MIVTPQTGMRVLRHALRATTAGRSGPVHINIPADFARAVVPHDVRDPVTYRPDTPSVPAGDLVARAVSLLARSKRPTIFAGHGVSLARAERELLALAELLDAAVCTSPKGKSVFPENHPLSLGAFGMGGHARADRYLDDDDVILVVGSSLNEFASSAWSQRLRATGAFVQIDVDPNEIGKNYPVSVGLVGDARLTLALLVEELRKQKMPARETRSLLDAIAKEVPRHEQASELESEGSPLSPPRVVAELRAAMPDDGMLFVDTGNSSLWGGHYFEARAPKTYFIDMGIASMGSSVAGAVGGALAAPDRKAVVLTGDAAFAMHGFEVHVAVEMKVPVVWVVLDNAGHGMIQQGERLAFGVDEGFYAFSRRIDSAAVGRALGARGVEVSTLDALKTELAEALAANEPTVINVIVDPSVVAPTLGRRAKSVAEFFGRSSVPRGPAGAG